jgi:recombination protein RecT
MTQIQKSSKTDLTTVNGFSSVLKNYQKSIAQLLQDKYGIGAEEFYVTCVNAVKKNPKLLQCDPHSLFGAILLSAEVGLRPNTPDQHAFIIPYKGQAKFQIGYKGLIEMMYRNPRVKSISAEAVFEKDDFDYGYGLEPYLKHKPFRGSERGKLVATYAVCKLKDADPVFTVVEGHQLEELKQFSQSKDSNYSPYNSGADVHHFMEIKASIKKLSKLIPKQNNFEISKAIEVDSKFEGGANVTVPLLSEQLDNVVPQLIETPKSGSMQSTFDDEPAIVETTQDKPEAVKEKQTIASSFEEEVDFSMVAEPEKEQAVEEETAPQEETDFFEKQDEEEADENQGSLF